MQPRPGLTSQTERPTTVDLNSRVLPPVPRIARAADPGRCPTAEQVAPYSKPAADVIARIRNIWQAAADAIETLEQSRPDGRIFRQVEDEAVKTNNPQAIVDLAAGEPDRYANAVVRCRRAVTDMSDLRADNHKLLATTATKIRQAMRTHIEEFAIHAATAWRARNKGAGLIAYEQAQANLNHIRELCAIADWCDATDREYAGHKNTALPPEAAGHYLAAGWHHHPEGGMFVPPAGVIMPDDWDPQPGRITATGITHGKGPYPVDVKRDPTTLIA